MCKQIGSNMFIDKIPYKQIRLQIVCIKKIWYKIAIKVWDAIKPHYIVFLSNESHSSLQHISLLPHSSMHCWKDSSGMSLRVVRRSRLVIVPPPKKINKMRTCRVVDFAVPTDHIVKLKESKKRDKYLDLAWELNKTMEHESDGDINCDQCVRYSHQRTGKGTGGIRYSTSGDHPNYSIIKIG